LLKKGGGENFGEPSRRLNKKLVHLLLGQPSYTASKIVKGLMMESELKYVAMNKLIKLVLCLTVLIRILWFVNTNRKVSS
jgi:hypothetical protein